MNSKKIKLLAIFVVIFGLFITLTARVPAQEETPDTPGTPESIVTPEETPGISSFSRGLTLFYQKRWADCSEFFEEAFENDPLDTMSLSFYLSASYKRKDLVKTVNHIEQKAMAGGKTPVLKAQLGIAYLTRGLIDPDMLEEARMQLKEALKEDPELSIANAGMGMIYYYKRLTSRAKGYFIKALKANDKDLMALELLGNILMVDEKKPDAALEFFLKLIELAPNYSDGYFMAGSAYQRMGKNTEAIKYFQKCMEIDPKGVMKGYDSPLRIGDIYLNDKNYDEAKKFFKMALEINPENPYAKTQLKRAENRGKGWSGEKYNPIKKKIED